MTKLRAPVDVETAFATYRLTEQLGEGGAGRVYGGTDSSGTAVAVKVLTSGTAEKRRQFKNEIAFLLRNKHPNIVNVIDHGVAAVAVVKGPFYVMPRFAGSLRSVIVQRVPPDKAMQLYSQILDGVEAAHLQGVTHRDLKPENILTTSGGNAVAVADFGIAHFTADFLQTAIETAATTRLANFQYAAPEQRATGREVTSAADIYALGLMLNELFTGHVPHGTEYQRIVAVAADYGFLDPIVGEMLRQNPSERPASIATIKGLIQRHRAEAVSLQKLNTLRDTVISAGEVDDPLAHEPPKLIGAEWDGNGVLRLTLDRPVHDQWVHALRHMGNFSAVMGIGPERFSFRGTTASVPVDTHSVQPVIDHFKNWLPKATSVLKSNLEYEIKSAKAEKLRLAPRYRSRGASAQNQSELADLTAMQPAQHGHSAARYRPSCWCLTRPRRWPPRDVLGPNGSEPRY